MSPGPWLEASHPWGTGLYDLEFHVLLVPIAIGTTDQVTDLEIRGFEITERDGLIAVSQDAIEMFLDHPCKAEVGFETAPFELGHPAVEEPAGPRLRSVGPEVTEGFLEHMSLEEKKEILKQNPKYSKIICRCESITEGEIIEAIKRPAGARTLDGVKRRVRPGSGRCQGGFCAPRVMEILSRELNIPIEELVKENHGSALVDSKIKGGDK